MSRSSLRCCIPGTPAPHAAGLKSQLQGDAGSCETAHDGADRNLHRFCGLLVTEPLDGNEQQGRSLIGRQAIERPPNLVESKPRFDPSYWLVRSQPILGDIAVLLAHVPRAHLIDPDRLHDAEHPTVEPCALLKLVLPCQRPLARSLNEIVSIGQGARKSASKTAQSRQDCDQLIAEPGAHRISARNQTRRRSRQSLT